MGESGFSLKDVTHVFLTHIHLDHAGAAGYLANQGAQIFVHPLGAPHMLNPEKLINSATRIYGELMDTLWGQFLAVPADKLTVLQDGDEVAIGKLRLTALDTPGHAEHHFAYVLDDICFSGDVGAVRKLVRIKVSKPGKRSASHPESYPAVGDTSSRAIASPTV